MALFRQHSGSVLGIDIGSAAVKVVELGGSANKPRIEACGVAPVPADAMADKNITNPDEVGKAIRAAVRRSGSKAKQAAVAVPGAAAITKVISLPASLSEDEMEQQVRMEADQHVPFPVEEVNFDFDVIGPSEREPDMVEALLVATRSENVDARVAAVEAAGLTPLYMDVEVYALERVVPFLSPNLAAGGNNQTVAVVDVGALTAEFTVLENQETVYHREQPFGGRQLTEDIAAHYELAIDEAEQAKITNGLGDNYIDDLYQPYMDDLGQLIMRSVQLYGSAHRGDSGIDLILIAGAGAFGPGVEGRLSGLVDTPVHLAHPAEVMKVAAKARNNTQAADASLALACGLALRGLS